MQRIAHELWDRAELKAKRQLGGPDVNSVTDSLVAGQSTYYEVLWEQLSARSAEPAGARREGPAEIYSQAIRSEYRLGPASTVQKALQALDSRDILDRYKDRYFFLDHYFPTGLGRRFRSLTPIGVTPHGINICLQLDYRLSVPRRWR